jgi:hypothetical protein
MLEYFDVSAFPHSESTTLELTGGIANANCLIVIRLSFFFVAKVHKRTFFSDYWLLIKCVLICNPALRRWEE